MKRYIIRISLVMLLGVVTSVAVAWACAWRHSILPQTQWNEAYGVVRSGDKRVFWQRDYVLGSTCVMVDDQYDYAYDFGRDSRPPYWLDAPHFDSDRDVGRRDEWAAGTPFRCLHGSSEFGPGSYFQMNVDTATGLIYGSDEQSGVVLPFHPILPGLLANTAIYGGVWWAMLFGPGMLIRWRRRRAGRCVKCGYDLRGNASDRCPECGIQR